MVFGIGKKKPKGLSEAEAKELLQKVLSARNLRDQYDFRQELIKIVDNPANTDVFLKLEIVKVIDQVVKLSDNMEHLITFLIILDKLLIHANTEQRLLIKDQLFNKNVFLIEKAFTFIKKVTKVVRMDDYNKVSNFNAKPSSYSALHTYQEATIETQMTESGLPLPSGMNKLPPMYDWERLAQSNDSLFYQDQLHNYKQNLEAQRDSEVQPNEGQKGVQFGQGPEQESAPVSEVVEQAKRNGDAGTRYTIGNNPYTRLPDQDEFEKMKKLTEDPPRDSKLLDKFHSNEPESAMMGRQLMDHSQPSVNFENLRRGYLPQGPYFPETVNEHEAFFNAATTYIDDKGMLVVRRPDGGLEFQGLVSKPGKVMVNMANHMRYLYLLFMLFLKKVSQFYPGELQKAAMRHETVDQGYKSSNSLLFYLLFLVHQCQLDKTLWPEMLAEILKVEGSFAMMAAQICATVAHSPDSINTTAQNQELIFWLMQIIKEFDAKDSKEGDFVVRKMVSMMTLFSENPFYKLTLANDKSIIEIFAYRLLVNCFLNIKRPQVDAQLKIELLKDLVDMFVNLSRDPNFVTHVQQAIKQEKIDILWRLLLFFTDAENFEKVYQSNNHVKYSLFVIDILKQLVESAHYLQPLYAEAVVLDVLCRLLDGKKDAEILVALCSLCSTMLLLSHSRRLIVSQLMRVLVHSDSKSPNAPQRVQFSLDPEKLDAYLVKVRDNLAYLYTYTGITKQIFYDIKEGVQTFEGTEEQFERKLEFVEGIQKGQWTECFNEDDLDSTVSLEQLKEAVLGPASLTSLKLNCPLSKENREVSLESLEDQFPKYAFEDSLKLLILKGLQMQSVGRRQKQQALVEMQNDKGRLIDGKTCAICKELRLMVNGGHDLMVKHYFQKLIEMEAQRKQAELSQVREGFKPVKKIATKSLAQQDEEKRTNEEFDPSTLDEIRQIEVYRIMLGFAASALIDKESEEQEEELEHLEEEEASKLGTPLQVSSSQQKQEVSKKRLTAENVVMEVLYQAINENEKTDAVSFMGFSMLFEKIVSSQIGQQKQTDPVLEFVIKCNLAQVAHMAFEVLFFIFKKPKESSFPLGFSVEEVSKTEKKVIANKKAKGRYTFDLKKQKKNEAYSGQNCILHSCSHFVRTFTFLVVNARKKYLQAMQQNYSLLLTQSLTAITLFATSKLPTQTQTKRAIKVLYKTCVTLIYRCFEHFFDSFEEVFPKLQGEQLVEFMSGLKSVKNLEIACQVIKLVNFSFMNLPRQKDQEQIMKALDKTAVSFLMNNVIRDLQAQCSGMLGFTNGTLGDVEKLNFDLQQAMDVLRRKLNFCILYFQVQSVFLSSEHAKENEKVTQIDSVKGVINTMATVLQAYLSLLSQSKEELPELQQDFQNLTDKFTLYLWLTSNVGAVAEYTGRSQALKSLVDSLLFLGNHSQSLVIAFAGLFYNVAEGMPDYPTLSFSQPLIIKALFQVLEQDEVAIEAIIFASKSVNKLLKTCPLEKTHELRPIANPLRKALAERFVRKAESLSERDFEFDSVALTVKQTLKALRAVEQLQIDAAQQRVRKSRKGLIQGAGLMSLETVSSVKEFLFPQDQGPTTIREVPLGSTEHPEVLGSMAPHITPALGATERDPAFQRGHLQMSMPSKLNFQTQSQPLLPRINERRETNLASVPSSSKGEPKTMLDSIDVEYRKLLEEKDKPIAWDLSKFKKQQELDSNQYSDYLKRRMLEEKARQQWPLSNPSRLYY